MLFRLYTSYTTLLIICAIAESSMKVLETYRQNRHMHLAIVSPNANIAKKNENIMHYMQFEKLHS